MRALVITNPRATAVTTRERDVLARALRSAVDVEIAETSHRGHAAALACRAMREGIELVVALGGDGTVNEIVQGLLTDGVHSDVPLLGVVPAGSTNVFARALEIPNDALAATAALLESLEAGRQRSIGLGRADERWFTFAAGLGLDAAVVAAVERRRSRGHRSTPGLYVRLAVREFAHMPRRQPPLRLTREDAAPLDGLHLAVVTNTSPWTYFGSRPLTPTPNASFDTGLDVYARRSMGVVGLARGFAQIARSQINPHGRSVTVLHDMTRFTLTADYPLPFQVDGDYLGERSEVEFSAHPGAIRVAC
ncbi:MAG: diacylglycerol kinase [Pseudonocardiales bacterium]|nr:diacylglycerol kinase [Pseudonocardiales bacterium]